MTDAQTIAMLRLLRGVPPDVRGTFSPDQIAALAPLLAARYAAPAIRVRHRVRFGPWRWYVHLMVGRDR